MNTTNHPLIALLLTALFAAALPAAEPATPNLGLRYYYEVPRADPPQTIRVDVCVYGGTPAGVGAAVQARRMGRTAALAVFRRHVGGMTSAGLTAVDLGKKESIGGMAAEFLDRMGRWSGFRADDAERTFRAMLEEAGVPVFFEHRLATVEKDGNRIRAVTFENGNRIEAGMFIDATYEGDLLARAGVSFTVGREDNSAYSESANGYFVSFKHQFRFPVDPYRTPGDPQSGLLPGISPEPPRPKGSGDRWVQAYNFRMWLTRATEGRPFPQPAGYNRDDYALLLRYLTSAPADFVWDWRYRHGPILLTLGDCNNAGPVSTDLIGGSFGWPEGDYAAREKIFQAHVTYQQGMMWFLANDPAVPEKLRAHVRTFGLPRDQFTETDGWPHELYVREGRRMVSDYVMTEHNCLGTTVAADSVGLASYTMDSHHTSRVVIDGVVRAEGTVEKPTPQPYPVSYRALVPRGAECANLLVPVCLSSTHIAYGSIRMEPVFMLLGQSAATAAAHALDAGVPVQKVDYAKLRARLLADHQKLEWTPPAAPVASPGGQVSRPNFHPGKPWTDTNGVPINAHAGGILQHDGVYYWFGQHMVGGPEGRNAQVGVHAYSSGNLHEWKDEGIALAVTDDPASDIARGCYLERPKVIYNRRTGKFVMWFHLELLNQGSDVARAGVAVADRPTGPYRFLHSFRPNAGILPLDGPPGLKEPLAPAEDALLQSLIPNGGLKRNFPEGLAFRRDFAAGQMSKDMTLFVDDDGTAYQIYASESNGTLHLSQLTADYLRDAGRFIRLLPGHFNEAPALFKHSGRYYLITSGVSGWMPNAARLAVADSIWGPWRELGNPCVGPDAGLTFGSQSTYVLPVYGRRDAFIFMADRWNRKDFIDSRHVWLPVQFKPDGTPFVEWTDAWDLDFFRRKAGN